MKSESLEFVQERESLGQGHVLDQVQALQNRFLDIKDPFKYL